MDTVNGILQLLISDYLPAEAAPVEEAPAPAEGEAPLEGEEALEPPPAPKKKPKFFVHWNRRKPRFYDYNWDYGDNYYSSLVKYMDTKSGGEFMLLSFTGVLLYLVSHVSLKPTIMFFVKESTTADPNDSYC